MDDAGDSGCRREAGHRHFGCNSPHSPQWGETMDPAGAHQQAKLSQAADVGYEHEKFTSQPRDHIGSSLASLIDGGGLSSYAEPVHRVLDQSLSPRMTKANSRGERKKKRKAEPILLINATSESQLTTHDSIPPRGRLSSSHHSGRAGSENGKMKRGIVIEEPRFHWLSGWRPAC